MRIELLKNKTIFLSRTILKKKLIFLLQFMLRFSAKFNSFA